MSFDKIFCSSPWFHMRIDNAGDLQYCRWAYGQNRFFSEKVINIQDTTIPEYFQKTMSPVRKNFLNGVKNEHCKSCYKMEEHNKVSGRQRQLLKTGIDPDIFSKTILSSDILDELKASYQTNGDTDLMPRDWQIDLGNYCNSACVFCHPRLSSKLALEWKKLNLISELPPPSWCNDDALLKKFVEEICVGDKIKYLHFVGGETLITPAFKTILEALISNNFNDRVIIGFTTNLISWDDSIVELLKNFKEVHVGVSIEAFHKVNDYVRWPSDLDTVRNILSRWEELKDKNGWILTLRITPTILTIKYLLTIIDYAYENSLPIESCNFIEDPAYMRPSVLPDQYRKDIIDELKSWTQSRKNESIATNYNTRDPNKCREYIVNDVNSYIDYLLKMPDESFRLPELVKYLKQLESLRKNSIIDYLPEYEELFRSAGY